MSESRTPINKRKLFSCDVKSALATTLWSTVVPTSYLYDLGGIEGQQDYAFHGVLCIPNVDLGKQ